MRKAARCHVCCGLASTQNEVIILDRQQSVSANSEYSLLTLHNHVTAVTVAFCWNPVRSVP